MIYSDEISCKIRNSNIIEIKKEGPAGQPDLIGGVMFG